MKQMQNNNSRRPRSYRRQPNGATNGVARVNNIMRVYDSNGPGGKLRGTPSQISEKYNVLAKDAQASGDNIKAESYLQHAEHYNRIVLDANANRQSQQNQRQTRRPNDNNHTNYQQGENGKVLENSVQTNAVEEDPIIQS